MKCKKCGKGAEHIYCPACNEKKWQAFEVENADDIAQIDKIIASGHPRHCACRQVWGDGECECDLYEKGYDPYAWMKK